MSGGGNISTSSFTNKRIRFTASVTGRFMPVVKLNWSAQPPIMVVSYMKNISLCPVSMNAAPNPILTQEETSMGPNPTMDKVIITSAKDLINTSVRVLYIDGSENTHLWIKAMVGLI